MKHLIFDQFGDLVPRFKDKYGCTFIKDTRAKNSLNKLLETSYKAVYRMESEYENQWYNKRVQWDSESFYIVTQKNRIICMDNSEWASFCEEG